MLSDCFELRWFVPSGRFQLNLRETLMMRNFRSIVQCCLTSNGAGWAALSWETARELIHETITECLVSNFDLSALGPIHYTTIDRVKHQLLPPF